MSVYDRWHLTHPENHPGWDHKKPEQRLMPCKCGRGKNKLYPTSEHGTPKRWQVRYRDDANKQRKRNFAERYGDDPDRHAEAYDAKVNAELDADTYIDPDVGNTPLRRFAAQWRAGLTSDPVTLEKVDRHLAHVYGPEDEPTLISRVGISKLARKPSLIQQWVKGLQAKGLAPGYIRVIADTLSSVFVAAIDDGAARSNPVRARSVRLPPAEEKKIEPWTPEMVEAAREDMEKRCGSGAMVDLGAGAGMRQGEIFALAEDDVTFLGRKRDRKIQVRRQIKLVKDPATGKAVPVFALPKRGKTREVPLPDSLARKLSAHMEAHSPVEMTLPWGKPGGKPTTVKLLFLRKDGKVWHRQNINHFWDMARKAAGAPVTRENGMHGLRHTFASVILHRGIDVIKLATWLGHTDPGFTLKFYGHFMPDLADLGREAVDDFLEPKDEKAEPEQGTSES